MKGNTLATVVDRSSVHRHYTTECFKTGPHYPRTALHYRNKPNFSKTGMHSKAVSPDNVPLNCLWISKIGNRVVGMARLVQDGPHSAQIVCFRVDPEWNHTKVPINLINSIHDFCENHGRLNIMIQPHIVPFWMMSLMNQHGFHLLK